MWHAPNLHTTSPRCDLSCSHTKSYDTLLMSFYIVFCTSAQCVWMREKCHINIVCRTNVRSIITVCMNADINLCVTFTPNQNTTPQALSHSKSKENEPKRARAHTHNFMHDGSSVHDVTDHDWQAPLWCQAKIVTSHVKHSLQLRVQLRSSRARLWCFVTVAPALFPSPRMHPWNILLEYFGLARCIRN